MSADILISKVAAVLSAGVRIIQYRNKADHQHNHYAMGRELRSLTTKHQALLIVNDDVVLAKSIHADGVHLGKDDCSIAEARIFLGENKIIGASCYDCFKNAVGAVAAGADYVAFGSFFNSVTKPSAPRAQLDLITRAKKELCSPVCAIGGITKDNVLPLLVAGVDMIAVISALFTSPSAHLAAKETLALLQKFDLTA